MFNTIAGKKITILGWAFKKDTGDTRYVVIYDVSLTVYNCCLVDQHNSLVLC